MRIATANTYTNSLNSLMDRQVALSNTQEQMTTGNRVNRASDDPAAAARTERALASVQRTVASQRAVDASGNAMTLTESALGDASELLQTARESLVSAGNASFTDAERLSVANSSRIFASNCSRSRTAPMARARISSAGRALGKRRFQTPRAACNFKAHRGRLNRRRARRFRSRSTVARRG